MGDIVNLSHYRKRAECAARDKQAAANRLRSGRTKVERLSGHQEDARRDAALDGKKLEKCRPAPAPRRPDEPEPA
jgi:hypothetical protein